MFVIVFSLLLLQFAIALPTDEPDSVEYREWVPSRVAYARDFQRLFDWVPWPSETEKRTPSIKERIQILENRQNVLFDLVRCESYRRSDCAPFRTQAETLFEVPTRGDDPTAPTKAATTRPVEGSTTLTGNRESKSSVLFDTTLESSTEADMTE